jgi:hypothetical protein
VSLDLNGRVLGTYRLFGGLINESERAAQNYWSAAAAHTVLGGSMLGVGTAFLFLD